MVAALYPRQRKNGAKVLVLSLPPAPSLSFFPPTSAKPLVALRFAGDAQDGATAKVTVAIATASDLGPGAAGTAGAAATGGGNQPALASSRGARVGGAAQQPSSCTHAGKASRHVAQAARGVDFKAQFALSLALVN